MLDFYFKSPGKFFKYAHKTMPEQCLGYHTHNLFEIYLVIKGESSLTINEKKYPMGRGSICLVNSFEAHKPDFYGSDIIERIIIEFDPALASFFSSDSYDLLHPFTKRPIGEQNYISLNDSQIDQFLDIYKKIESVHKSDEHSALMLKLSYFLELLVLVNEYHSYAYDYSRDNSSSNIKLSKILKFIDENLNKDLSLKTLNEHFHFNPSYLSSMFKKSMGINIHEYILVKRISFARTLLSRGINSTEACFAAGFKDYSSFNRAFNRVVGMSPKKFKGRI